MPIVSLEQLKQDAVAGRISGISIDTSIYEQYQFGLESGVLAQMEQFARLDIAHLMVDTILDEVEHHLKDKAELHKAHLKNSLKPLGNYWGTPKETRDEVMHCLFGDQDTDKRVKARVANFVELSAATILKCAEHADIETLVSFYFEAKAPFSTKQSKKHEFPDALTLISLQNWAAQKKTHVIVISKDGDWKKFCENSKFIYFIDDLPSALSIFQGGAEEAKLLFTAALKADGIEDLNKAIESSINDQADKIDSDFEATSNWYFEPELSEISAALLESVSNQLFDFEVLDYQNNQITLKATITVELSVQYIVNFQHWDGIDREYLPMGSATLDTTEPADVEVIITALFDNGTVSIENVELIPHRIALDFGDIEPDWMGQYDDREYEID
ncbi:MAG: PIN domain-containing protein [Pseudomonadota bacterium]